MANYKQIKCTIACNKLKRKNPYAFDLNIYRGCEHGCKYCYALYSHDYLEGGSFFENIYVKENILEVLEKQFKSPSWNRDVVNIGSVCDSYQPAEAHFKIMPEIWKLFIKYKTPCIISSKSQLILRDYDLIDELSRLTYVNIAQTITCADESLRKKLEPLGAPSLNRFEVLRIFSKTNASTGLHIMPIIPYLTDDIKNLSLLYEYGKKSNVSYVLSGTLNLRGRTRYVFLDFIRTEFANLYQPLENLYKLGSLDSQYKKSLYKSIAQLHCEFELSSDYMSIMRKKLKDDRPVQLSFFD